MKKFIRLMHELNLIQLKNYLLLQKQLQEISKMATGWMKYSQKKEL
ncbi:hypothetical protein KJ885_05465 [Patescibacteria group bacterium]|nr:hypothetical protein [Patescibacteria group bacterium]